MSAPLRYLHYGDMWNGIPHNQYGFGVLKANPYQRGFGVYRPKRQRRQGGHGLGSLLVSIGRRVAPVAKRAIKGAVKQGIKQLPGLITASNKKQAAKQMAQNIGKQALSSAIAQVSGSRRPVAPKRRKVRRVKRRGQLSQRR